MYPQGCQIACGRHLDFLSNKNSHPHVSVRSLTLAGPTPTNISRNSEPLTVMKGTFASPAVAFANRVFPVPGGPVRMAP